MGVLRLHRNSIYFDICSLETIPVSTNSVGDKQWMELLGCLPSAPVPTLEQGEDELLPESKLRGRSPGGVWCWMCLEEGILGSVIFLAAMIKDLPWWSGVVPVLYGVKQVMNLTLWIPNCQSHSFPCAWYRVDVTLLNIVGYFIPLHTFRSLCLG